MVGLLPVQSVYAIKLHGRAPSSSLQAGNDAAEDYLNAPVLPEQELAVLGVCGVLKYWEARTKIPSQARLAQFAIDVLSAACECETPRSSSAANHSLNSYLC